MAGKKRLCTALLTVSFVLLTACAAAPTDIPLEESAALPTAQRQVSRISTESKSSSRSKPNATSKGTVSPTPAPQKGFTPYKAPAFAQSGFDKNAAQGGNGVLLDLSGASRGYVAVSAKGKARMKFRVEKGENTYTYDLPSDGTPAVYPLQCGDGEYTLRALENTSGTKYAEAYSTVCPVTLTDEFQPFLRPNQYVDYSQSSACVKAAAGLAAKESNALGVVESVFTYICENVTYDKEKAATVTGGYLPKPDETLSTGKGICFDYASLAAAMLRSQGIPTKVVFGYVQPDDLYHAWNMFYTKESGWVAAQYQVESNSWSRLDPTFAANGADSQFVGDGTNYTDVYFY